MNKSVHFFYLKKNEPKKGGFSNAEEALPTPHGEEVLCQHEQQETILSLTWQVCHFFLSMQIVHNQMFTRLVIGRGNT